MVIDTVGRSRYNILGGDDIDVDLASYLLAAWDFGNGKQLLQEPIELRTRLYELFLRKATEYKEEFEFALANGTGSPEFVIDEELVSGNDRRRIRFRRTVTPREL